MTKIAYPAPPLTQRSDQELLLDIGGLLDPKLVTRDSDADELLLWVDGPVSERATTEAHQRFSVLLGVLRAWRPDAGERTVEREAEVGHGPIRDASGNQTIVVGTARISVRFPGEVEVFAAQAHDAMVRHPGLREALELYGSADRDAADYFNIGELCAKDLGRKNIALRELAEKLAIPLDDLKVFNWSANNIKASEGGRHALQDRLGEPPVPDAGVWNLGVMRRFAATIIRSWMAIQ